MKKIKITEKQARLLGLTKVNETTKSNKTVLKITKEQYNRLFASGLINENVDMDNSSPYVEYLKDMSGEEPFTIGDNKYQYVWAKYPSGKTDIGVYAFGQDLVYDYNAFRKMHNINEMDAPKISGGLSRVDSAFKKTFANADVQDLGEEKFDITKPIAGLSKDAQGSFGKPITEGDDDLTKETNDLIKYLYRKSDDFSSYWDKHGVTYDDIIDALTDKNLIIGKNGKYEVSKSHGTPQDAINAIKHELNNLIGGEVSEASNLPAGAEYDSRAPYMDTTKVGVEYDVVTKNNLEPIYYNGEIVILNDSNGSMYVYYYAEDADDIVKFGEAPYTTEPDGEGGYDTVYDYTDIEPNEESLYNYINAMLDKNQLSIGDGMDSYYSDNVSKIDSELKSELLNTYGNDKKLASIISGINEGGSEDAIQKFKADIKASSTAKDVSSSETPEEKKKRIEAKLAELKAKEKARREKEKKDIESQWNDAEQVDEMTSASSSGAYTGLFSASGNKGQFGPDSQSLKVPVVKEDAESKKKSKIVIETSDAGVGNMQYATPGFPPSKFMGTSGKKGKAPVNKGATHKNTTWANGTFVEFDDCTKLNNNKEAQNGGCSTGAVDNVVKQRKTASNLTAPSLNESFIGEALKLQYDKDKKELIVISDLEGKAASQETFKNKNVLKQNGFNWNGSNWVISSDKLEDAKRTLSLVNKAEYLIDKLEDLEDAIMDSGSDKKTLLKAKLDQYISDLANATDEKALSAEINRYLTFFSKFHSYSFYNRILIYIQRPDATRVASYKKWQEKFRQVKQGAKAITVLAPIISKKAGEEGADDELSSKSDVKGFRPVNVFDISDTEPIDERGNVPSEPQWWGDNTPSETADTLFKAISEVASDMGINVTQDTAKGGEKGFSAGDHINLSADISGVGKLSTMIHEMAHELMHHKSSSIYYQGDDVRRNAKLVELQAESVSYVVLAHYGLPTPQHATYLALWKASKESIQANLEVISKVSEFIIKKIDEEVKTIDSSNEENK